MRYATHAEFFKEIKSINFSVKCIVFRVAKINRDSTVVIKHLLAMKEAVQDNEIMKKIQSLVSNP